MGESLKVADKVILGNNNYAPPIVKPNGSQDPIQVFTGFDWLRSVPADGA